MLTIWTHYRADRPLFASIGEGDWQRRRAICWLLTEPGQITDDPEKVNCPDCLHMMSRAVKEWAFNQP